MEQLFIDFFQNTGFFLCDYRNLVMILVGITFIYLGIAKHYEPLLLVPIGFGMLMGNIPVFQGLGLGIYENNSVLHYLYFGVTQGIYPPLIFLGIGAMTDFSTLLARPVLMLLGAAAQAGIFITFLGALALGFAPTKPPPSASSVELTVPQPYFSRPNWPPNSSAPLPWPLTPTWPWYR